MSFYYLIDQYPFQPNLSFSSLIQHNLAPISNIFILQQELPYIPNLNLYVEPTQITQPTPIQDPTPPTPTPQPTLPKKQRAKPKKSIKHRRRNLDKQLQSAKKNSESNIINQIFSFLSSPQKSADLLNKAIRFVGKPQSSSQTIRNIFYNTVRLFNYKRGRKYVNRQILNYFKEPTAFLRYAPGITQRLAEAGVLTLNELIMIFRVCILYFMKEISPLAILHSRKISSCVRYEHLKRRRLVMDDIQGIFE